MAEVKYNYNGIDLNPQTPIYFSNTPKLTPEAVNAMNPKLSSEVMNRINSQQTTLWRNLLLNNMYRLIGAYGINQLSGQLSNTLSNNIFGNDTLTGQAFGQIFSSGISSASDTLSNNILKGQVLSDGLLQNTGASVAGTAAGVTGNLIGRGINDLGGDSMLSRGIGQGVATGIGTIGGGALANVIKGERAFGEISDSVNAIKTFNKAKKLRDFAKGSPEAMEALKASKLGAFNLAGLGGQVIGAGLQAAFGPSKEYGGKYGGITRGMDTAYDLILAGVGFIPGVGTGISGIMALNKGLSNVFGSTSGMTRQDAILGSAFMPAPVKWLNMAGAKTTDKFSNQSWLNLEKSTSFMQDAFGDLQDKFDKAREEAGKTYGTFSRHAYNKAQGNVEFANRAWGLIMDMADLNELQNIRSLYMTSVNNQRYAQDIMGGFHPLYRGKQGMKIFNNTTNHNIGMRLLSAAALIDNKAMILSALSGTKVKRPKMRPYGSPERTRPSYMTEEEWNEYLEDKKRFEEYKKSIGKEADYGTPYTEKELQLLKEYNALKQAEINLKILERNKAKEEAAARFNKQVNTVMGAMTQQANETPFTGQEYQQAAENLRQEKVENFHEKAEELGKGFNAALMADLAVSAAPLLLRSFRWVFNKAGLLVKVPVLKISIANNLTSHVQGDEAVKMFKEYGGTPIPEGSINGEQLRKYVMEARERYGLIGNNSITDEEIAQALYKHSKELGGNTAAVNALGEPLLLFRGDTLRYTLLKERMSPEELAEKSGTMDNSLGNLFLGELPGTAGKRTKGLERYLVTGNEFIEKRLEGSGTGSRAIMPDGTFATEWGNTVSEFPKGSYHLVTYNTKHGPNVYYKLPASFSESGVNDINAFVVRTPQMRDASKEISVLNDDFIVQGGPKVEYHGPIRREILDKDGFPLIVDENGNVVANGLAGSSDRRAMAQHYRYVLNDAKTKKQGLLKSKGETDGESGNYLRDEHDDYSYFALPNFNIRNAKHLLPYDLRIPRDWTNPNIYKAVTPYIIGGSTAATLYNTNK